MLSPRVRIFLKILWGWRTRYVDHFVFALHVQATIFLMLVLFYLGPKEFGAFHGFVGFALFVTLWRAFAGNYGHGALTRALLLLPTMIVYFVALILVMTVIIFLGVALG